jgi:hypothetical protein
VIAHRGFTPLRIADWIADCGLRIGVVPIGDALNLQWAMAWISNRRWRQSAIGNGVNQQSAM